LSGWLVGTSVRKSKASPSAGSSMRVGIGSRELSSEQNSRCLATSIFCQAPRLATMVTSGIVLLCRQETRRLSGDEALISQLHAAWSAFGQNRKVSPDVASARHVSTAGSSAERVA